MSKQFFRFVIYLQLFIILALLIVVTAGEHILTYM